MDIATLVKPLNIAALVVIMLSMGLNVKFEEVLASTRQPRPVLLGLIANFALVPAVTLALLLLFHADPMVSVGFFILAVCPGAPVGPPLAVIAKGNIPLAVSVMVILAGLSVILSPALLTELLGRIAPDYDLHINYLAIVRVLLIAQMLPLALGLGLHAWAPRLIQRIAKPVGVAANVLLLALVAVIVARQYETLAAIRFRGWIGMGTLLLSSLALGWLCGWPDPANSKTMAFTTAPRNAAVGLVIANSNFAGTPAVTAVVAYGVISMMGSLGAALLMGRFTACEIESARAG